MQWLKFFFWVQIKLFDLRLIQKGGIQSYEGHVNSHTHLPLVVDPSETLLMSGLFIFSSKHYYVYLAPSVFVIYFCYMVLGRMIFFITP